MSVRTEVLRNRCCISRLLVAGDSSSDWRLATDHFGWAEISRAPTLLARPAVAPDPSLRSSRGVALLCRAMPCTSLRPKHYFLQMTACTGSQDDQPIGVTVRLAVMRLKHETISQHAFTALAPLR